MARELLLRFLQNQYGWGGKSMKDFDQWMKELSKQIVTQNDEQDIKAIGKANEFLSDDDFEEE